MTLRIVTGTPGAGKTAMVVADLMQPEFSDRPLFVMGISGLTLDHSPVPPVAEWTKLVPNKDDPTILEPEFTFPPRSIIVIDEAQRVFRPRASGSKVPDHVAAMEKHRHGGVDFWLMTQKPGLLDANIRDLCGCHVHLRQTAIGRWRYEWPEMADPKSKNDRDIASRRRYKLPKEAFDKYVSSKHHIVHKHALPNSVIMLAVVAVAVCALGWYLYGRYNQVRAELSGEAPRPGVTVPGEPGAKGQGAPVPPPDPVATYLAANKPRLDGYVHTAPAYDGLTQPTEVPVPAGCVSNKTQCKCYTQQATPYALPESECRHIAAHGLFLAFNPSGIKQQQQAQQPQQRQQQPQQPPQQVAQASFPGFPAKDVFVGPGTKPVPLVSD
ncbi:zonular occludens toxin domain-containing protein [Zoogloea sp.]|uniref:zonular occludens toxin domain-containing protein n=1 Tax=Zoogloea sp. TaxID=49181 RepID=UPI001AC215EF|nr:zonular occludens toxin domain-containing protein [Zoogloea sp.]MBN8281940.1 hypothetical protein [Zoogloea sp.]